MTAARTRPSGIIMDDESVRTILSGEKTQTHRLIAPQPAHVQRHEWRGKVLYDEEHRLWWWRRHFFENLIDVQDGRRALAALCPFGVVGDRIWVREVWSHDAGDLNTCRAAHEDVTGCSVYGPYYRATEIAPDTLRWMRPIHMPQWASRISLEVTDVRVQRTREITEADAYAEAVDAWDGQLDEAEIVRHAKAMGSTSADSLPWLATIWNKHHGKKAPWESNPWVWAITFKRVP